MSNDECALILHMWICIFTYFYTYALWRSSAPFRHLQHLFMFSNSKISCTYVHHLWISCHMFTHHTSVYLCKVFNIIYTCATTYCQNLHTSADTHPFISHHIPGTLYCISEHLPAWKHTYAKYPVLSTHSMQNICITFRNVWTSIHSIPQHSWHIYMHPQIFLLCKDMLPCFLWSPFFPINSASFAHPLKFSIDFRSIVKHSYFPPPFFELIGAWFSFNYPFLFTFYFFLLLHFSSFLLISFMFHDSDLYTFVHIFHVTFFQIFSNICTFMYL